MHTTIATPFHPRRSSQLPYSITRFSVQSTAYRVRIRCNIIKLARNIRGIENRTTNKQPRINFQLPTVLQLHNGPTSRRSHRVTRTRVTTRRVHLPFTMHITNSHNRTIGLPLVHFFTNVQNGRLRVQSNSNRIARLISSTVRPIRVPVIFSKLRTVSTRSNGNRNISTNLTRRTSIIVPSFLQPLIKAVITARDSTTSIHNRRF